ncbi:coiled-coil domain-containing protein [Sphingomicrobium arenosum]|uniref:hypothetical protein n=1 Tax=Sphingomicrobium arenosum TaxID=2233861 RepID=UPI00223F1D8F|nr:hypothetical protein [Sphingomicrobium arenosum]
MPQTVIFADLVRETSSTTGTDNILLGGAITGMRSFADAVAPGESFHYSMIGSDKPQESEAGVGTLQPDGTILRAPSGGVFTNFSAGEKVVSLVAGAAWYGDTDQVLATQSENITILQAAGDAQDSAIATLQAAGDAHDGAIVALQGAGAAQDGAIASLEATQAGQDSAIANLQAAEQAQNASIAGKADVDHGHALSDIADLEARLSELAASAVGNVTPERYGAVGDGVADDGAALLAAMTAMQSAGGILKLAGRYRTTQAITLPDACMMTGGGTLITENSAGLTVGNDCIFHNVSIVSTHSNHLALYCVDKHAPRLLDCRIDGRIYCRNDGAVALRGPRIDRSHFDVDFGDDYDGVEQMDLFSIYGFEGGHVRGCDIRTANIHRLFKISDSLAGTETSVSNANSRAFEISGNLLRGSGGKQVVDCYRATSGLRFVGNQLELSGAPTYAGPSWAVVIDDKSAGNERDADDIGATYLISGNCGTIPCAFVSLQGAFGITEPGHSGDRRASVHLIDNKIRCTSSDKAVVEIRFFDDVRCRGNLLETNPAVDATVMRLLSNDEAVLSDETYRGGIVHLSKATSNASGLSFGGSFGRIDLRRVSVRNFDASGGVRCDRHRGNALTIDGLFCSSVDTPTQLCRAIYFSSGEMLSLLDIQNVDAEHGTGGNITPVLDSVAQAALRTYRDNGWQPRARLAISGGVPTSGVFLRGDRVSELSPGTSKGVDYVCISGGSPGTWRMSSHVPNKAASIYRPSLAAEHAGFLYFDTGLAASGKPIWWTGSQWVDAAGVAV